MLIRVFNNRTGELYRTYQGDCYVRDSQNTDSFMIMVERDEEDELGNVRENNVGVARYSKGNFSFAETSHSEAININERERGFITLNKRYAVKGEKESENLGASRK